MSLNHHKLYRTTAKGYQQATPLIINPKDGSVLVRIPAGEFEMGDDTDEDNPKHNVYLDTYYIGVYTVTNRQYKEFVNQTEHRPPNLGSWGKGVWKGSSYPAPYADHPVVCVSWGDAETYCRWAGLSLPTEAQWEKAARGLQGFLHPWGDAWEEDKCRHNDNRGSEETCAVHKHGPGVSGYGTYNQSGNVSEWCKDYYDKNYYNYSSSSNPDGPSSGVNCVYRGGNWLEDTDDCRAAYRKCNGWDLRVTSLGLRVALVPDQQGQKD